MSLTASGEEEKTTSKINTTAGKAKSHRQTELHLNHWLNMKQGQDMAFPSCYVLCWSGFFFFACCQKWVICKTCYLVIQIKYCLFALHCRDYDHVKHLDFSYRTRFANTNKMAVKVLFYWWRRNTHINNDSIEILYLRLLEVCWYDCQERCITELTLYWVQPLNLYSDTKLWKLAQ